jgi:hypothetical protein
MGIRPPDHLYLKIKIGQSESSAFRDFVLLKRSFQSFQIFHAVVNCVSTEEQEDVQDTKSTPRKQQNAEEEGNISTCD